MAHVVPMLTKENVLKSSINFLEIKVHLQIDMIFNMLIKLIKRRIRTMNLLLKILALFSIAHYMNFITVLLKLLVIKEINCFQTIEIFIK